MDDALQEEVRQLVARIVLGGERGRKLLLRAFLRSLISGNQQTGFAILRAAMDKMPTEDWQRVMATVSEIVSALTFDEEE